MYVRPTSYMFGATSGIVNAFWYEIAAISIVVNVGIYVSTLLLAQSSLGSSGGDESARKKASRCQRQSGLAYNLRFPGQYYMAETGLNQNTYRGLCALRVRVRTTNQSVSSSFERLGPQLIEVVAPRLHHLSTCLEP
jgi:hypothetical protein